MPWQVSPEVLMTMGRSIDDNVSEAQGLIVRLTQLRDMCNTPAFRGPAAAAAYQTIDQLVQNHTSINNCHSETANNLSTCGVISADTQAEQASLLMLDPGTVRL
jgi:uncharacterized protein YukE